MMAPVEFFFDFRSPYSYLAFSQLGDIGLAIRPMDVLEVMKEVGNTPTTIVCAAKGRYAGADLQRWTALYRLPFQRHPEMRSVDGRRLLRAVLAAGDQARAAVAALFPAMWGDPQPLATPEDVAALLAKAGVTVDAATLDDPSLDARLSEASHAAAERGVFGAPTFITGGEMFFGNDRLDFLRRHLEQAA
ncbi:MAG: 2-hydroxychromene-2-carboxylate isomerase [Phenylobacterium sp.]